MANVPETPSFDAGIYQIETTDPVLGGPNGIANAQAKGLANRTAFLKQQIDQLNSGQLAPAWIASQDYVQEQLQKLDAKQSVRAATTANITLSGVQAIDGVALTVGDRVLVKDQAAAEQNGIYLVAAQSWTRATDADNGTKLSCAARIAVEEGAINAGRVWSLSTVGTIMLGNTMLQFKDEHQAATQQQVGVVRLATQSESISGELENVAVSPSSMAAAINAHYLAAGTPLPTANIGPIWHDDYNDWMTWQTFDQNGANYTGYASCQIGGLLLDTQPTPRSGYIKSGVQNLSRVTYAALRAWAMHNGLMVAPGVWAAGAIQCADNADGTTFRIYDVRGEFLRAWDDNRGLDIGRALFSVQADAMQNVTGSINVTAASDEPLSTADVSKWVTSGVLDINRSPMSHNSVQTNGLPGSGIGGFTFDLSRQARTATETHPHNSALLAAIKY